MIIESFGGIELDTLEVQNCWVVPDAGSIMYTLINQKEEKIEIVLIQMIDIDEYIEGQIPGRIYKNNQLMDLHSKEEKDLTLILKESIKKQLLGHPEGLEVLITEKFIDFFESDKASKLDDYIRNSTYIKQQEGDCIFYIRKEG